MKKLITILFLISTSLNAQVETRSSAKKPYYLEDQLYVGVTYSALRNKPTSIDLRGFSNSIFVGYIRDIPLNEERNFGVGFGLGYGKDTYFHNMKIANENNKVIFENFGSTDNFNNNKLVFHTIEFPFEIRWRTSTIDNFKFWRIYTGVKFAYIFNSKAEFNLNGLQKVSNFDEVNKFQYGLSLSIGHGTLNGFIYYGLSNIFKDAKFNGTDPIKMKSFRLGLIFYIL